ncbi:MAG TPA: hypothetical protein VF737_10355 [Gemmatimonadaceae bacterium]
MQLDLSQHESELLRDLLRDYLPSLKREVARTEKHTLRHELVERQDLVEHLLEKIGARAG